MLAHGVPTPDGVSSPATARRRRALGGSSSRSSSSRRARTPRSASRCARWCTTAASCARAWPRCARATASRRWSSASSTGASSTSRSSATATRCRCTRSTSPRCPPGARASSPTTASGTRPRRVPRHALGARRGARRRRARGPRDAARAAFAALELRDYARVDLRLAADGPPYVIDVNPNCDLSDGAGVSRAASFGGLAYPDLIERICEARSHAIEKRAAHVDRGTAPAPAAPPPLPRSSWRRRAAIRRLQPQRSRCARTSCCREDGAVHEGRGVGRARAHRRRAR